MRRLSRGCLVLLLGVGFLAGPGCGDSSSKPNPELKVPDVPPGGPGAKKGVIQPGKK